MIEKLTLIKNNIDFQNFTHINKLDFFNKNKEIEFVKGVNLVVGKNGSGKSTLLNILATGLAAKQGGYSKITNNWFQNFNGFNEDKSFLSNFNIKHDGQGVIYQNPRESIGLIFGQFDDDFMNEGILNVQNKNSTGLTTIDRLNLFFKYIETKEDIHFNTHFLNNCQYVDLENKIDVFLKGCIEKGQKTIIMDEPETGLSFEYQFNLFNLIQTKSTELDLQIIISTHSPALYLFKNAKIIELSDNYLESLDIKIFTIYDLMIQSLLRAQ